MNEIICAINEIASAGFDKMTLSNPVRRSNDIKRIMIERRQDSYAATFFHDKKAMHRNFSDIGSVMEFLSDDVILGYKQTDIIKGSENARIISNKHGHFKIERKALPPVSIPKLSNRHDREKNHILREGEPVDFLIQLGITSADGYVKKDFRKKFAQINSFLEIVKDVSRYLEDGAEIVDFGCGKSYLTFALYYYLNKTLNKNVSMTGVDLKEDVIAFCNETAEKIGYGRLSFVCGDISKSDAIKRADMVVSLHACDTASDFALYKAILWNARVILCAPCCQHELSREISNKNLNLILKHGILKERLSAIVTDAFRASALADMGYSVSVIEFIDSEHTPKNVMLKAVKTSRRLERVSGETRALMGFFDVTPTLCSLLETPREVL